ncbi:hypothetical protein N4G70_36035 [Streptomyces sp. ASQP_92]|uniref:hypothetical protein n=1 Tax=Streptomyces sp. ASQP_92 TaxID=2979116 RepID=UPI0021C0C7A8|nr:hypothetical protein [Streptomyces sp. ASQP_92]MCT9094212.1 hypothetical protein [Streptomyces sp. ASQP_92]
MRITRARMTTEADYWQNVAAPQAATAAAENKSMAKDLAHDDYVRECAARRAELAEANEREYLVLAEQLRAGEIPDGYRFD